MSMVKIDGSKIKQLREQQGLTQLYLATAVEVTTDTISRWENRRYPSIKKDNGLKLAEALNVQLEDILEDISEEATKEQDSDNTQPLPPSNEPNSLDTTTAKLSRNWPLLILSGLLLILGIAFFWYFFNLHAARPFAAERIMPAHCIANQPFPVIIKVTGATDTTTAVIIKESIPKNATILDTSPKVSSGGLKNMQIKWLNKIEGQAIFAYMARVSGNNTEKITFSGTAAISGRAESAITGKKTITIGLHHWADTNEDNVISDAEILSVYDRYSELTDIDLDIDLIEEIWMGSEYRWDSATATFKIID